MCIVSTAWKCHPRWKLVVAGNRDEFHGRPAEPLARWQEQPELIAGKDTQAGGTWLGVSEQGRFAVVTNVAGFGAPNANKSSRGDLLKDFLSATGSYANLDIDQLSEFNPFNLVTVSDDQAVVHSNRPENTSQALPAGIHGLSNGTLEQPWPKTKYLNASLANWLIEDAQDASALLDVLGDRRHHSIGTSDVDNTHTEPHHSTLFLCSPTYGTRCSTVLAIDHAGKGYIVERRYCASGVAVGETRFDFVWPNNPSKQ